MPNKSTTDINIKILQQQVDEAKPDEDPRTLGLLLSQVKTHSQFMDTLRQKFTENQHWQELVKQARIRYTPLHNKILNQVESQCSAENRSTDKAKNRISNNH